MREPKHSCPDIDQMKRWLKVAHDELVTASEILQKIVAKLEDEPNFYLVDSLLNAMETRISEAQKYIDTDQQLEDIRDLNSDLRSWGSHWESEYQKLESQS